jgi:hypothetical protein
VGWWFHGLALAAGLSMLLASGAAYIAIKLAGGTPSSSPAKAATLTQFKQHLAHLAWLDGPGPARAWLAGIPAPKVAQFAGEAHVTDVADLRKMGAARRLALVVCLLHQAQVRARDEVATTFCKRMAAIARRPRSQHALLVDPRPRSSSPGTSAPCSQASRPRRLGGQSR